MGFLDKAKAVAEQAATKAKDTVEDVQLKRDLGQAYDELGKKAFELIESGAVTHPELEAAAEKIRALDARGAENDADDAPAAAASTGIVEPTEEPTEEPTAPTAAS